jgi:hypothetical protein
LHSYRLIVLVGPPNVRKSYPQSPPTTIPHLPQSIPSHPFSFPLVTLIPHFLTQSIETRKIQPKMGMPDSGASTALFILTGSHKIVIFVPISHLLNVKTFEMQQTLSDFDKLLKCVMITCTLYIRFLYICFY